VPRASRYRIGAIADLRRQLAYAPAEARRRHMLAAEALAETIDDELNYPEDFIIFRITGYRPDAPENPATFVGAALISDLATLVQELSETLDLLPAERAEPAWPLDELAARIGVSTKTLQRYRKRGLICHYVRFEDHGQRLACFEGSLARFARRHPRLLEQAAGFSRLAPADEGRIVAEARRLRAREGLTLNQAARRIAAGRGRSIETVRRILRKHDESACDPIFTERGPLTDREHELLVRGWRRGVPVRRLAERVGRSGSAVVRVVARLRAQALRDLAFEHVELPTFGLEDAGEVILAAPAVTSGLDELPPRDEALALIAWARAHPEEATAREEAIVAGANFLKRRARLAIDALPDRPTFAALDATETDLRWAAALLRCLVAMGLGAALRRLEANLHQPLERQSAEEIRGLVALAAREVALVAESLDPARGHHLARRVAYELDRRLAREDLGSRAARAGARHEPGSVPIDDPLVGLRPWADAVEPPSRWRRLVGELPPDLRDLATARFGWAGAPPLTIAGCAKVTGMSLRRTERALGRAEAALRAAAR
jgi:RNA polymerase primary sigma factor